MFFKTGKSSVLATSDSQLDLFSNDSNIKAEESKEENCDCSLKADSQVDASA